MVRPHARPSRHVRWLVVAGVWLALGVANGAIYAVSFIAAGLPVPWSRGVFGELAYALAWLPLSSPIAAWLDRVPLAGSRRRGVALALHAVAGFAVSVLHLAAMVALAFVWSALVGDPFYFDSLRGAFGRPAVAASTAVVNLMVYWAMVALWFGFAYYELYRSRDWHALRLERELMEAQREVLTGQLQPHFLFNTLHTVSALTKADPDQAQHVVARLGEVLRYVLEMSKRPLVTLHEELTLVRNYVAIEKARFRDRLQLTLDVEPAVEGLLVPPLALQLLVENAIRHGLGTTVKRLEVVVTGRGEAGSLVLCVEDDCPSSAAGERSPGLGLGLRNVESRLRGLFPGRHELSAGERTGGGFRIELRIPAEPASDTTSVAPVTNAVP